MRYRGHRRGHPTATDVRGRHRRPKDASAAADRAQAEHAAEHPVEHTAERTVEHTFECADARPANRPRLLQPRDARGRFRKAEPGEEMLRRPETPEGDAADAPDAPGEHPLSADSSGEEAGRSYTWRDFELGEDLPRASPHPSDAADVRDGRRHCGALEDILYRQWAEDTTDPELKAVLLHNAREEIEHASMVLEWIRRSDAEFDEHLREYLFQSGSITGREHDVEQGES